MVNTLKGRPSGALYTKPHQNPLSEFVIGSASDLVSKFLEAEVEEFLSNYAELTAENGKTRMVRNGYLPERKVKTALGRVPVKIPRVRDRLRDGNAQKIRFNSRLISPYQRRTNVRENVINRYLVQIMAGEMVEATAAVLGNRINHATPNTVRRLREMFENHKEDNFEGKMFKNIWIDRIPACEAEIGKSAPLMVAVGETYGQEKFLLFVMEDSGNGESMMQKVDRQIKGMKLQGDPIISMPESTSTMTH